MFKLANTAWNKSNSPAKKQTAKRNRKGTYHVLGICRAQTRIAIYHKNVKKMLNHFTDQLSDYNITNMSNTSKGAYAYTLLDLDEKIPDEVLERLSKVEGTIRIRVVK